MIFRSPEAKNDLVRSWHRPDRPFFAAGACHLLAAAFLKTYPDAGYCPFVVVPEAGHRGGHVFVSNGEKVFDYHGFSNKGAYLSHHSSKIRQFFPDWRGTIVPLDEFPGGESFCHKYRCRRPDQYLHDPWPRAFSYLQRFAIPLRA